MEKNWKPKAVNSKTIYIICPDMNCNGWEKNKLQCDDMENKCPYLDKAKKIVFCHYGHPNEMSVDSSSWCRVDCNYKDCHSCSFILMSGKYRRIPLNKLEEFLKIPFEKC